MARLYKCYGSCGEKHEIEQMVEQGGKRYCKVCLEEREKEQETRNSLYAVIKNLYQISYPNGMMLKQIKQYKEQFGYTYEGIEKTLRYLSGKPGIEFKVGYGLGIVTYKYDEAQAFYKKQEEIAMASMFKDGKPEIEEVVIRTAKPNNNNVIKMEKIINLEDLI